MTSPPDECESAKRKVLFFVGTLGVGGAERFVSTCLRLLDRRKFELALAVFRPEFSYPLPSDVRVIGLGKTTPFSLLSATWRLARSIDALRPDILLSAWSHPNLVAAAALRVSHCKPAWIARIASDPNRVEPWPLNVWARRSYVRADHVLVNSAGLRDEFNRLYAAAGKKARVLYNPVDFDYLDLISREELSLPGIDGPLLVWIGRLEREKRPDVMIAAMHLLKTPNVRLLMLGSGKLKAECEEMIRGFGLTTSITLMGFSANPFAYLSRADGYVLTSDSEGLPNALIEAQGLGVPSISTDCRYGPAEILEAGRTGMLVPPSDPQAVAAAIDRLLGDQEWSRSARAAARERARRLFSAESLVQDLSDLLLNSAAHQVRSS